VIRCYQSFLQYLEGKGIPPKIVRVPEVVVAQSDWKASGMKAELDRSQCDYVYLTQDLIELKGRKYHVKGIISNNFKKNIPTNIFAHP